MPTASTRPTPGEVWYAELGMMAKGRPVLVLYYPRRDDARALSIVAPLTSQIRGERGEVDLGSLHWLPKRSAVNVQGIASVDRHKLERKLGKLSNEMMAEIKAELCDLLDI